MQGKIAYMAIRRNRQPIEIENPTEEKLTEFLDMGYEIDIFHIEGHHITQLANITNN